MYTIICDDQRIKLNKVELDSLSNLNGYKMFLSSYNKRTHTASKQNCTVKLHCGERCILTEIIRNAL